MKKPISTKIIENRIFLVRGVRVMLDEDLAALYGVETKQLKRAVKRNNDRFPEDFMFVLTNEEYRFLRCQFGTLKRGKHSKYLPYVFTEQGVSMLSSVLNSKRAIQVNIAIIRVFVKLKKIAFIQKDIIYRLNELERMVASHDKAILSIFKAIKQLMEPPPPKPKRRIGFHHE